jgi:hypothetical protein
MHWFDSAFIISEVILIILYAVCTEYGDGVHPSFRKNVVSGGDLGDEFSSVELNSLMEKDKVQ